MYKETNDLYLIPSGFEGAILVFYNVPKTPALRREGKYTVIPVLEASLKQLRDTNINNYGIYLTSTPDMKDGIESNKYFYVNENGERKAIDEKCTSVRGKCSFTRENGEEIRYKSIQITKKDCSQKFWFDGKPLYDLQEREVTRVWMNNLE